MSDVILKATYETLYMVIGSTFFAVVLGFIPAIVLTLTAPDGLIKLFIQFLMYL